MAEKLEEVWAKYLGKPGKKEEELLTLVKGLKGVTVSDYKAFLTKKHIPSLGGKALKEDFQKKVVSMIMAGAESPDEPEPTKPVAKPTVKPVSKPVLKPEKTENKDFHQTEDSIDIDETEVKGITFPSTPDPRAGIIDEILQSGTTFAVSTRVVKKKPTKKVALWGGMAPVPINLKPLPTSRKEEKRK